MFPMVTIDAVDSPKEPRTSDREREGAASRKAGRSL